MSRRQYGLSLIELMIAMLIGTILLIGVIQIFIASRTAYALSEGLARVQENGRFAMDFLQRDIRMAGHLGCANDQARLQTAGGVVNHLSAADNPLNFAVSIQGYDATGTTSAGGTVSLSSPATGWSPALPDYLKLLGSPPLAGSDVIVLRFLYPEGAPVTAVSASGVSVAQSTWKAVTANGVGSPTLFGVADCSYVDIYQGAPSTAGGVVSIPPNTSSGLNVLGFDFAGRYAATSIGQVTLYRAESVAYYVANGSNGERSLFRARFTSTTQSGAIVEELVEGVESIQFLYGRDQSTNLASLSGNITFQDSADVLSTAADQWRRVGQVQVGIVVKSANAASVGTQQLGVRALGLTFNAPQDGRLRSTYEGTVALRNRLYGN